LWCALGFILLHFYIKKWRSFDGEVFLIYVIWYGSGRAFIEGLRTDSLMAGDLRVSQVLALASAAFALVQFVYFKATLTKKKGYTIYKDTDESKQTIIEYKYEVQLLKEKEDAKKILRRTQKEVDNNGENS
jgi:phosphatidylglycerol:prolipoprotein diacylglycerol transferase